MTGMSAGTTGHASPEGPTSADDQQSEPQEPPSQPIEIDDLALVHAQARHRAEGGNLTGARTLMEDAIAVAEHRLGRDDPRLAPLMVDLATIARNLGNLTEARAQLRRAYSIVVATAGPEHATSLSIEGRLAAITHRLGEPTEAYDWHLAEAGMRVLGPDHPAVRGAKQRLAKAPSIPDHVPKDDLPPTPGSVSVGLEDDPHIEPGFAPTVADRSSDPPTYSSPGYESAQGYTGGPEAADARYAPTDYPGVYQRNADDAPPSYEDTYGQDPEPWREPEMPTIRSYRRRGNVGGVALVASLGAAILIAAIVIAMQVFGPSQPSTPVAGATSAGPSSAAPSEAAAAAPGDVRIRVDGGSATLTWTDPSEGTVAFIVAGAREGEAFKAIASVPAGRTTLVLYGLNIGYNYCFTVSAIWAPEVITPSIRTCTSRLSTPPAS
jgi:hypothetical protein